MIPGVNGEQSDLNMKINKLVTTAAVIVALSMITPSAFAITAAQAKAVKKAVSSVPVAEMPAKAAELVKQASKEDREDVAVTAVRAGILKSRTSARLIVSAVVKAAPEVAGAVTMAASEMDSTQAGGIAGAAISSAPSSSKSTIVASANQGVRMASVPTTATTTTFASHSYSANLAPSVSESPIIRISRGSSAAPVTAPVTQSNTPINTTSGGVGNGTYTGATATSETSPTVVDYSQPRS
jgi:hypothetical protein